MATDSSTVIRVACSTRCRTRQLSVPVSNRKPTPLTVVIRRGLVASSPSFRRNQDTCMSSVLVDPHHSAPHTSRIRSSRVTTLPDSRTSTVSRSYRSEEHTSELQSRGHLVCRLLLEKTIDG